MPSQRDLHGQPVFPQPPANVGDARLWEDKIISMPDPAVFSVNGVSMGVTAADILFHLGKEEISFPPRSGDRYVMHDHKGLSTSVKFQRKVYRSSVFKDQSI